METFKEIQQKYESKMTKGYDQGLGFIDYDALCKCRKQLTKIGLNDPKVNELYGLIDDLVTYLVKEGAASKFSHKNKEYIKSHSILLPLPTVDCSDRAVDDDNSSLFYFDFDGKKSLIVKDIKNGFIYDDGYDILTGNLKDAIDYLRFAHNFKMNDSLETLCRTFMFDLPEKKDLFSWKDVQRAASKYRRCIVSESLPKTIDESFEAAAKLDEYKGMDLEQLYRERMAIIERVKSGEYDPNFVHELPPLVKLKK